VQIQQVLLNLVRNAFEAMSKSERRLLTVSARHVADMVEVRVADTGPGLAPEVAEHLFQPFHSTKEGGMGVGLSLCRKIIDSHGGKLWHEPSERGAVFAFSVPALKSSS
jgi:C4-dicarboxylate-specific signal transduction histidine kinase